MGFLAIALKFLYIQNVLLHQRLFIFPVYQWFVHHECALPFEVK